MKQLKWTTVSSWVDETLEIFKYINEISDIATISQKIKNGELFEDRKENSAKRVFTAIRSRYLKNESNQILALSKVLNSNIPLQEKKNYLFIFFLEYETLACLFWESYVYNNFDKYSQKVFTQMDLDKFFETVFGQYRELLPSNVQDGVSSASMLKVRNVLYKNFEGFGWANCSDNQMTIKRPSLTPEWFVFVLYLYYENESLNVKEIYTTPIFKRFLLNKYDIDYLLSGAKIKGLVDANKLGDINTLTKHEKGLLEYAGNY